MATARDVGKALATLPQKALPTAGGMLKRLVDAAVDGIDPLPSARVSAGRYLEKRGDVDQAIDALVAQHIAMASAQGFVTNLGGILTAIVTTPANLTGVIVIQIRMVACIAHLRGYDVNDNRVRTAMLMCLLGEEELAEGIATGTLPTTPLAVATAPVFDAQLDQVVCERVVTALLSGMGGKRLTAMMGRRIPLVGGGVGAAYDGYATHRIGVCARTHLVNRRRLTR
jgi:uncharacterized protein (DUF697 family)